MADFGLKVVNQNGYIQIDSLFRNLCLVKSGTVIPTALWANQGYRSATVSIVGENPVIAIRSPVNTVIADITKSGSTTTFTIIAKGDGISVNYYIFDNPPISGGGNYGLLIRNASNQVVFDSRFLYMKVLAAVRGSTIQEVPNSPKDYSFPGRTVAIIQGQYFRQSVYAPLGGPVNPDEWLYVYELSTHSTPAISTARIVVDETVIQTVGSSAGLPNYALYSWDYLVIDITGY